MKKIELVEKILQVYDVYNKALLWNSKEVNIEDIGIEWITGHMFAAYNDDELEAMGLINQHHFSEEYGSSVSFSIKVNPECKDDKIVTELIDKMLHYSKYDLMAQRAYIKLLKKDEVLLENIENSEFNFKKFDNETITFTKKLINR